MRCELSLSLSGVNKEGPRDLPGWCPQAEEDGTEMSKVAMGWIIIVGYLVLVGVGGWEFLKRRRGRGRGGGDWENGSEGGGGEGDLEKRMMRIEEDVKRLRGRAVDVRS